MKFAAWFAIIIGLGMFGQWGFSIAKGQVPEFVTEPYRIYFHLAAEFSTAAVLLASGWALLRSLKWAGNAFLVGSGMLLYSVVVSPGYFAQLGQWAPVGMFAVILILALIAIRSVARLGETQ